LFVLPFFYYLFYFITVIVVFQHLLFKTKDRPLWTAFWIKEKAAKAMLYKASL